MRSFHHSRGRIFFEVLCAFGISASCVGAWMQTYSTAMLGAAAIAALYGLVHFFDMFGRSPAIAEAVVEPAENQDILPIYEEIEGETVAVYYQTTDNPVVEAEPVVPVTPLSSGSRRSKVPRKSGNRRTKASKEASVAKSAAPEEPTITESARTEEPEEVVPAPPPEEENHSPVVPLFEPDPFVRQQRTVFGRKAG